MGRDDWETKEYEKLIEDTGSYIKIPYFNCSKHYTTFNRNEVCPKCYDDLEFELTTLKTQLNKFEEYIKEQYHGADEIIRKIKYNKTLQT